MKWATVSAGLGLSCIGYAAVSSKCPSSDVCYQLNIPDDTRESGHGDIYFQLSAPTSYSWVALGQGDSMSGSNMFVMYVDSSGDNITVSPRLGTGHSMPKHNGDAQITVLEGSGVSDGRMTANVRCGNCDSWSDGSMDFSGGSSDWIYAVKSGSSLDSDDTSESMSKHDLASSFSWDLSAASGGDNVNPFTSESASAGTPSASGELSCIPIASGSATSGASKTLTEPSGSGCPTTWPTHFTTAWPTQQPIWASTCFTVQNRDYGSWPTDAPWRAPDNQKRQSSSDNCPEGYELAPDTSLRDPNESTARGFASAAQQHNFVLAHAALASTAFIALFPSGAILIRLATFPHTIWLHALLQLLAYTLYIAAFCLGLYLATQMHMLTHAHPVIGIVLFALLFLQPPLGWLHHKLFKKCNQRTLYSYVHIGVGRIAVLLGIVNGGLGLGLADAESWKMVAYGVVAAVVGLAYVGVMVYGECKRRRFGKAGLVTSPPSYEVSQKTLGDSPAESAVGAEGFYAKREREFDGA